MDPNVSASLGNEQTGGNSNDQPTAIIPAIDSAISKIQGFRFNAEGFNADADGMSMSTGTAQEAPRQAYFLPPPPRPPIQTPYEATYSMYETPYLRPYGAPMQSPTPSMRPNSNGSQ